MLTHLDCSPSHWAYQDFISADERMTLLLIQSLGLDADDFVGLPQRQRTKKL